MNGNKEEKFSLMRFLCSLGLALILWYYINGSSSNIVTRNINDVPVALVNEEALTQKDLSIEDDFEYFVNLRVRGSEETLESINTNELVAEVDLAKIEAPGTQNMDVVVRGLNNQVILDGTVPGTVQLTVREVKTSVKTPTIIAQGKPAEGYSVISATTDQQVVLEGLQVRLDRVKEVSGTVTVNGLSESSEQSVKVYPYDEEGNVVRGVECNPTSVTAQVDVGVVKTVPVNAPVVAGTITPGYKITDVKVSPNQVMIAGSMQTISQVASINVEEITVPTGEGHSSFTLESDMILPKEVSLFEDQNRTVQVTVTIEQIIERAYTIDNLEVTGLENGLMVNRINPGSVVLRVSGTASEIQKIDASKLKGVIDVAGKKEGNHKIEVTVNVTDVSIVSISPETVDVEIKKKE